MKFTNRKEKALALAVLATLAMPVTAFAADSDETKAKSRDIVVTANKVAAEIKAVPQAVEVITAEDIKKSGASDLLSALRRANNIDLSEAGMTGNEVSLRGNDTTHTLILVDGKRIAGEDTSTTGNRNTLSRINLHNVERIEIVRGNASVLYGSDAIGGVINIITKNPSETGFLIGANTGSKVMSNYYHAEFADGGNWSGTFDANFSKTRDYVPDGHRGTPYGNRQYFDLKTVYDFKNDSHNKIIFSADYGKEHTKGDYRNARKQVDKWDTNSYSYDITYSGKTAKNDYSYRVYYNKMDKDYLSSYGSTPFNKDVLNYNTYAFEAKDSMFIDDYHTLTFGGEWRRYNYDSTRLGGDPTGVNKAMAKRSTTTYAGYIEDMWQINDKWLFVPSARYEHHSMFGSNVVGKAGFTYSADKNNRLKATYGRGYKAPSVSELYLNFNHYVTILGNPDLKPEKSLNFDLSYESEFGDGWAKLTYFYNKVSNKISTLPYGSWLIQKYYNIDKALIQGYEVEVGTKLSDKWNAKLNVNKTHAVDQSDYSRLNFSPLYKTTVSLNYDEGVANGYSASLWSDSYTDYRYSGKDYNYTTINFALNKQFTERFSMNAGIDNLFNREVSDIYLWGRIWHVGAEWKF